MFINREEELKALGDRYASTKAEFMVLYGRRRVGKTELIDYFLQNKRGIRLLARMESEKSNLDRFSKDLSTFFKDEVLRTNPFQNWDAFFSYLTNVAEQQRVVIAIDEFPYLIDANKSIPSILQDYWDRKLRHSHLFLILCGSSIAMMLDKVLGHKSPLYGRRTGQLKIEPMDFFNACHFYKKFTPECLIYTYSILGGTPGYLMEFDENLSITENIKEKFLKKDRFLFQDAEFVLKEELQEPKFYFSILRSIALGKTRLSDIMNETGLDKSIVVKYLSILIDLDIVKREIPVTEKNPYKSRKGIYLLKHNFYKFWFRFIFPNTQEIERNRQDRLMSGIILTDLDHYTSFIFEDICKEWLWKLNVFDYDTLGRWWDKEEEIDIIAFNQKDKKILFAECKWQEKVNAEQVLHELKTKTTKVEWGTNREELFAIFAKSFRKKISGHNLFCFDMADLKKMIGK